MPPQLAEKVQLNVKKNTDTTIRLFLVQLCRDDQWSSDRFVTTIRSFEILSGYRIRIYSDIAVSRPISIMSRKVV